MIFLWFHHQWRLDWLIDLPCCGLVSAARERWFVMHVAVGRIRFVAVSLWSCVTLQTQREDQCKDTRFGTDACFLSIGFANPSALQLEDVRIFRISALQEEMSQPITNRGLSAHSVFWFYEIARVPKLSNIVFKHILRVYRCNNVSRSQKSKLLIVPKISRFHTDSKLFKNMQHFFQNTIDLFGWTFVFKIIQKYSRFTKIPPSCLTVFI